MIFVQSREIRQGLVPALFLSDRFVCVGVCAIAAIILPKLICDEHIPHIIGTINSFTLVDRNTVLSRNFQLEWLWVQQVNVETLCRQSSGPLFLDPQRNR